MSLLPKCEVLQELNLSLSVQCPLEDEGKMSENIPPWQ